MLYLYLVLTEDRSVLQHNNKTKVLMRGEGSRGTDNNFIEIY